MRIRTLQFAFIIIFMAIVSAPLTTATGQQFRPSNNQNAQDESLKLTARYHIERGTKRGFLIVKAKIPDDSYIYSLSQTAPLIPSKLSFKPNTRIQAAGKFKADKMPKVIEKDPVFETRLEKHIGTVQFFVPIKVDSTESLKSFKPTILYNGQVCSNKGFCRPINNLAIQAVFAGYFDREAKKPHLGVREK